MFLATASVRPVIKVPEAARRELLAAAPVLFSVWALSGLFGSLGRDLVHQVAPKAVQHERDIDAMPAEFLRDDQTLPLHPARPQVVHIDRHRHRPCGIAGT